MRLINRRWALEIGPDGGDGTRYDGISMTASVVLGAGPATSQITVRNPGSRIPDLLGRNDTLVRLLAGYQEGGPVELARGAIIRGSVVDRRTEEQPAIDFGVRDLGLRLADRVLARTWSQVTAEEVVRWVAEQVEMPIDALIPGRSVTYVRGYAVSGRALPVLRSLALDLRCAMAVVDGRLRLWPSDGSASTLPSDVLETATGLLEVATSTSSTELRVVALLRPAVRPGDRVTVIAPNFTGVLSVRGVRHTLDTDGEAWWSEITGRPAA